MSADDSVTDVFVYGTLTFPPIIQAVIDKLPSGQKAKLHNFAAYAVVGSVYPGIWHLEGVDTDGILYHDIGKEDMLKLDRYEGEEYNRELLSVETEDGNEHQAWVYIFRPAYRHLLSSKPWDARKFEDESLESYLAELK